MMHPERLSAEHGGYVLELAKDGQTRAWIEAASDADLIDALALLSRELRQRQNGEPACAPLPPADSAVPKLLTAKEVAGLLGLSEQRIYALARENRIGGVVHTGPRQVRFERSGLEAWVRNGGEARE